jgi:hypothetical protein
MICYYLIFFLSLSGSRVEGGVQALKIIASFNRLDVACYACVWTTMTSLAQVSEKDGSGAQDNIADALWSSHCTVGQPELLP